MHQRSQPRHQDRSVTEPHSPFVRAVGPPRYDGAVPARRSLLVEDHYSPDVQKVDLSPWMRTPLDEPAPEVSERRRIPQRSPLPLFPEASKYDCCLRPQYLALRAKVPETKERPAQRLLYMESGIALLAGEGVKTGKPRPTVRMFSSRGIAVGCDSSLRSE